jgi:cation diffusion facilitator CzcD-associated flavoprotein CzcO
MAWVNRKEMPLMTLDVVIVGAGASGLMQVVRARLAGNTGDCFGETPKPHGFVESPWTSIADDGARCKRRFANIGLHAYFP